VLLWYIIRGVANLPVVFNGLRLTVRCGEQIAGQRHNQRLQSWKAPPATYTSYVWIYEW